MARPEVERWLRPRVVFPVLAALVAAAVLASPGLRSGDGVARLSTQSADPYGARGLYEVMQRLGWPVERRVTPLRTALDTAATYVLLDPPVPPTGGEVAQLLAAARRGATLIATPDADTPLADSLGVQRSDFGYYPIAEATRGTEEEEPDSTDLWPLLGEGARLNYFLEPAPPPGLADSLRITWARADTALSLPGDTAFVSVRHNRRGRWRTRAAILGFELGRGRVILMADAGILRNGRLREGESAVLAVRMAEWLAPRGRRVVFSEYHQGYGRHADPVGAIWGALWLTPAGRATLQMLIAGAVILLVIGVRAIPPGEHTIVERRSPLEHVGALARAYEQVGATRTAARRLVRGLRRRHPLGAATAGDDEAYLQALEERMPSARDEIQLLRRAMQTPLPPDELVAVGEAIHHIERVTAT
ncbi:MAG TPA: DUF4350 domain-containing protein [Gemmatimonadaceae bacterium]|nr:DUF4350 domain-containing protein [Gemmatimonadaceae bacterium]